MGVSTLSLLAQNKGAVCVAAVANTASLLFGYDTGVAGSVVALQRSTFPTFVCRGRAKKHSTDTNSFSFASEFEYSTNLAKKADVSSNIVALLNAGAFFGAVAPALFSRWIGRRPMMAIAAFFMIVGGILQTAAQPPALSMIYGGRILSGFGVGMVSNLTPVYVAETAPKELRGMLMSLFEMFLVCGGLLAYWTTYGCSLHLAPISMQWRIPLSIQIILAAIVLAGSFVICESPRWLARQDRWDEAHKNLRYLRGGADSVDLELKTELAEMQAQIEEELEATAGRSLKELSQRRNLLRLVWGCGVSFFSIWGGQTALLYYGPVVFGQIGFIGQNAALFASGMFTVIKVIITVGFLVMGVQQFKRKHLLSLGALIMAVTMFGLGAILRTHPPIAGHVSNNTSSGRGMVC